MYKQWQYKLGQFAKLIGVHPKTLQRYDRENILKANRTDTNRRYYTATQCTEWLLDNDNVERLQEIDYLLDDEYEFDDENFDMKLHTVRSNLDEPISIDDYDGWEDMQEFEERAGLSFQ